MVNKSGYDGKDPQWWAESFLGTRGSSILTCETTSTFNGNLCPKEDVFSFLIPVVNKNKSIYFNNTMKINDYLSFDLGYRYDRIKYQPNYSSDSPKIPDDMVKELFIPFVGKPLVKEPPVPKYWEYPQGFSDPNYLKAKAEYDAAIAENKKIEAENVEARKQ
ncbi:TPA: TonB-dependent receptor, partial [Pasteurella multocida]|nr:TonB-dependent receptor [Pasteurella multocida]